MATQVQEQVYHSQNFKPNKKKVLKPPYLCYALIIIYSLYILLPLYIILITSFKTYGDASSSVFLWWPVSGFSFDAYTNIIWPEMGTILNGLLNTVIYYVPRTLIAVFVSTMAAYGFAKVEWRGKDAIFGFLMLTMMIPGTITMSASRMYMAILGWESTANPIIIPGLFGGIGTVFFLRQYVMGIPDDLIGAAKIDGMNEVSIFLTLIVPLTMPAITTQAVLGFIGSYNSYLDVLIYLGNYPEKYTIQLVLKQASGFYSSYKNVTMAYCVVGMFPLIILYLVLQDYILKGISMSSGLKG